MFDGTRQTVAMEFTIYKDNLQSYSPLNDFL